MTRSTPLPRVTQHDVAKSAGVSRGLVSQVLAGTDRASSEVRGRIKRAAAELGYRTNYAAAQLATRRSGILALAVPRLDNTVYHELYAGISEASSAAGLSVLMTVVPQGEARPGPSIDRLLGLAPEGLVLVDPSLEDAALRDIARVVPTVVTGRERSVEHVTSVGIDEMSAARDVVAHLTGQGIRRVFYVTSPATELEPNNASREAAVIAAAVGAEVEVDVLHCASEELDELLPVLGDRQRIGVVAYNDLLAIEVLALVGDSGREAGADVAVVSYDDSPLARARRLGLTSVDINARNMGDIAVQALFDPTRQGATQTVPHRLVVRRSSLGMHPEETARQETVSEDATP